MRSLISQKDIDHIRTEAEAVLPDFCTIQEGTRASDGQGRNPITFADTYTDVPCRLMPFTQRQIEEAERRGQIMTDRPFLLTLRRSQPIAADNRVKKNAVTYEVSYIDDGKSYQATKRVQVVRIEAS